MLRLLSIRDVVLIDRLELHFDTGLGVLTGETGAGKSILLDALGLALGARADSGLIRAGAAQAVVTAEFDIAADRSIASLLAEQGFDIDDDTILVRRVVDRDGRSRAFINDQPATAGLLRQVGERLVEIQGQFERFALAAPAAQRAALDSYGKLTEAAANVAELYTRWSTAQQALARAEADIAATRAEEERLRHDVAELDQLEPGRDEETALASQRQLLQNAERLIAAFDQARQELAGESGAEPALRRAASMLARASEFSGGRLDPVIAALDRGAAEIEDAVQELQSLAYTIDCDASQLEAVEHRLFTLRAIARKHGCTVAQLAEIHARLSEQLAALENDSGRLADLAKACEAARRAYIAAAEKLSVRRGKAARALDRAVAAELAPLKLDKAVFETEVTRLPDDGWSATGIDRIEFRVATNPGSDRHAKSLRVSPRRWHWMPWPSEGTST